MLEFLFFLSVCCLALGLIIIVKEGCSRKRLDDAIIVGIILTMAGLFLVIIFARQIKLAKISDQIQQTQQIEY